MEWDEGWVYAMSTPPVALLSSLRGGEPPKWKEEGGEGDDWARLEAENSVIGER